MNGSHLVREARRRADMTQVELAEKVGTTQSAVARLESGRTRPSLDLIVRSVEACGYDVAIEILPRDEDDHDWSLVAGRLRLTPDERILANAAAARFVFAARAAVAEKRESDHVV